MNSRCSVELSTNNAHIDLSMGNSQWTRVFISSQWKLSIGQSLSSQWTSLNRINSQWTISKAKLYNPKKGISRKSFLKGRFMFCSEPIQGIEFQFNYTAPEVNCAKQQQQLSLSTLHAQEGQQPIPPTPRVVEQPIHSTPRWQGAVLLCQLHFQTSRSNIFRPIFPSFLGTFSDLF